MVATPIERTFESHAARLLKTLRDKKGQWVNNMELYRTLNISVYARIYGLRRRGHKIESRRVDQRNWEYRLVAEAGEV